jgi:hypothetical protein
LDDFKLWSAFIHAYSCSLKETSYIYNLASPIIYDQILPTVKIEKEINQNKNKIIIKMYMEVCENLRSFFGTSVI